MKNYQAIDIFKFAAAIMVVAIHTHPLLSTSVDYDYFLTCACRIAIPFFFIFSSFIFFQKGIDIRRYVKRMLLLYIVWFIIESPLIIQDFFISPDRSFPYKIFLFLRGLFIHSTFEGSWFITASWEGMLILWLLSRKLNWKQLFVLGFLCYLSAMPESMYYGLFANTKFESIYRYYNILLCPSNSFITAIPFLIFGKYIADKQPFTPPRSKIWPYLIGAILIGGFEIYLCKDLYRLNDTFMSLLLICPLVVLLLLQTEINFPDSVSKFLRHSSILIYLLHLPIFRFLRTAGLTYGWPSFFLVLLISLLISTVILLISKRIKIFRYLY